MVKYKVKEYGYLEKDRSFLQKSSTARSIINNNQRFELSKLEILCLLKLLEDISYSDTKDDIQRNDVQRFYKMPLIKKNIKKIDINVMAYPIGEHQIKRKNIGNIIRYSIFNKIGMGIFEKKRWSEENQKLLVENILNFKENSSYHLYPHLNMEKIIVAPLEALDLCLDNKDNDLIKFLYENAEHKELSELVNYTREFKDDNPGKIRETLRGMISRELFIDTYKDMLRNHMSEIRKIYNGYSDTEIYSDILKKMKEKIPNIFYVLLEDNKYEGWMDNNLLVTILNEISVEKPIELSTRWNSRNTAWTTCIEQTMLLTQNFKQNNNSKDVLDINGKIKYTSLMKNIAENAHNYSMIELSTFSPYAKEISILGKYVEDYLEETKQTDRFNQIVTFKMFSYINPLKRIFENGVFLEKTDPQTYILEEKTKECMLNIFTPKVKIDNDGNAGLNTHVFNFDVKEEDVDIIYKAVGNKNISIDYTQRMFHFINPSLMVEALEYLRSSSNSSSMLRDILEIKLNEEKQLIDFRIKNSSKNGESLVRLLPKLMMLIRKEIEGDIEETYLEDFINRKEQIINFINLTKTVNEQNIQSMVHKNIIETLFPILDLKQDMEASYKYEYNILHKSYKMSSVFSDTDKVSSLYAKIHKLCLEIKLDEVKVDDSIKRQKKKI